MFGKRLKSITKTQHFINLVYLLGPCFPVYYLFLGDVGLRMAGGLGCGVEDGRGVGMWYWGYPDRKRYPNRRRGIDFGGVLVYFQVIGSLGKEYGVTFQHFWGFREARCEGLGTVLVDSPVLSGGCNLHSLPTVGAKVLRSPVKMGINPSRSLFWIAFIFFEAKTSGDNPNFLSFRMFVVFFS